MTFFLPLIDFLDPAKTKMIGVNHRATALHLRGHRGLVPKQGLRRRKQNSAKK